MNVCYTGAIRDISGYGEASRNHVIALDSANVNVYVKPIAFMTERADFGNAGLICDKLANNKIDYKIKLIHVTPDLAPTYIESGKYNIAFCYWETDLIPDEFKWGLEKVDEIWTGSKANEQAIRKAGITKPIYIFPQSIDTDIENVEKFKIPGFNGFLFYSIFEWTERKNPQALLKAYWNEFSANENVALLIKTHYKGKTKENKRFIDRSIRSFKSKLIIDKYPKSYIYTEFMDSDEMKRLHATGDCFVSTHRGEGWGLPQVEAAIAGKPVISTAYSGCHEYFDNTNMRLMPYKMVPVKGMNDFNHFYKINQNWADISQKELRKAMREIFEQEKTRKTIGDNARNNAQTLFNYKRVGNLMKNRLEEINNKI